MTGVVVLLVVLAVCAAAAVGMRWKNGRFVDRADRDDRERLTPEQIGVPLGERATMVQFSSAFCSPCRATRVLLADVAGRVEGVVAVEIDAEAQLALVRELDIMRTPTVLILDAEGVVVTRASGLPRRDQVLSAVNAAMSGRD